ncbi:hypothetical protein FD961_02275 [Polynucleobacter sp. TSB-Sco08W16]|uniref:hypothetical protein n=1 Tax=Polynucleobacter sp. TSB-Sco08W16 TaxID=1758374 RepID=UPI001BFDEEC4|nr:hypothetical protein [Polynucleobacter sp. TSB-Sco08W16]QWD74672.1 hypothetical protein FD961_02275 [Polynucleobacter sp. TSB-Sco08W16]
MTKLYKLFALAGFAMIANAAYAQSTVNPMPTVNDNWRFSASINAWAPASQTTDSKADRSFSSSNSIDQNINAAGPMAMFTLEAHKGNWGVMGDLVYWQSKFNGSSSDTRYIRGADTSFYAGYSGSLTQTMFTGAATYTALNAPSIYLDGLLGARYISSTMALSDARQLDRNGNVLVAHAGNPSRVNYTTDPILGFKGRARIMDSSWFVPFYADAGKGPGSNNGTWQASLGVGDAFSWGEVALVYRAMGFHLKDTSGSSNWTNAGPQLSATINF